MPWVEGGLAGLLLFCVLEISAKCRGMVQYTMLQATMTTTTTPQVPMMPTTNEYDVPPTELSSTSVSISDTGGNGIKDAMESSTLSPTGPPTVSPSMPPPTPHPTSTPPLPPSPLRLCSVPRITAGDGTNNNALYNNKSHTALLTFQCGGDEYYQFGRRILDLHQKLTTTTTTTQKQRSPPQLLLGRRDSPLPGKDKSILFIGNSHTRQQVETLLCQYSDMLESGYFDTEETAAEGKVYLKHHNHTIQWVTNNFAFYGHDWQNRLETLIDKPLADHDAIIVGRFNQLNESWNTTFYKQMLAFGAMDKSIDFEHIKPPNLEQVAAVTYLKIR
jgi:hypothetical protein